MCLISSKSRYGSCIFFGGLRLPIVFEVAPAPVFFKRLRLQGTKNLLLRLPSTVLKNMIKSQNCLVLCALCPLLNNYTIEGLTLTLYFETCFLQLIIASEYELITTIKHPPPHNNYPVPTERYRLV